MPSTSAVVNRSLRTHVAPLLREMGFAKVDARNGWFWGDKVVWVFNIRAVGRYFADVTGWPPGSVNVWLGVFYAFLPTPPSIKSDELGRVLPAEYECHMRSQLDCGLEQRLRVRSLSNPAERRRKDIWWVQPDGANAEEVASDIAVALAERGFSWFKSVSNLETALASVEAERDCFVKFVRASYLARELGDRQRWTKYERLAEAEARRIGHDTDRTTWYVTGIPTP